MVDVSLAPRRFLLVRSEDISGVSGTGAVAQGVQLYTGQVVVSWLREPNGMGIYQSIDDAITVHGHGGATVVEWIDEADPAPVYEIAGRRIA
jgi:hypothetical protein